MTLNGLVCVEYTEESNGSVEWQWTCERIPGLNRHQAIRLTCEVSRIESDADRFRDRSTIDTFVWSNQPIVT